MYIPKEKNYFSKSLSLFILVIVFILTASSANAAGYDNALKGVSDYKAVFEFSQGDPKTANLIFWAVKNSYEVDEVKELPGAKDIVVVFHGPAVKLLSTHKPLYNLAEWPEVEKLHKTIREMKKDGVRFEVCLYAVKVLGVDETSIIPEVDKVGNGFVSVIGYQMQNYAVVRIP